jgi:glycosyltransferase involved in cell wall biosynthesis
MINIFINALSASAGGGLTYVRNVLPCLGARDDVHATVLVSESLRKEIRASTRITVLEDHSPSHSARRFWYEQLALPKIILRSGADVLLSTGNFAVFRSPIPQILLSRNALYTSADFFRDLRDRGDYRLWLDTKIKATVARQSVLVSDCAVAPSQTFAEELQRWTGKNAVSIHHGFNPQAFFSQSESLPSDVQAKLDVTQDAVRILFVSHYNYYRNFETLIRAIAIAKKKLSPRKVRLILTCKLASGNNPGTYNAEPAASLVEKLQLRDEIIELGSVPYNSLHYLYRACDLYATAAYAETFAHPLVEAMASGLPVIASDLAVHREICGPAALYFPRFSQEDLAARIIQLSAFSATNKEMCQLGLARSQDFSWDKHVDQLLLLARHLTKNSGAG